MLEWEQKIADNQALIDGIRGLENALFGMSDAMILNEEQFDSFEQASRDGYQSLIDQGFTANEALGMMAPTLQRLQFLQKEFGLTVDEGTQALIDEADGLGLLKEDPINRMADAMERFIELLSKQLGLVTGNIIDDFEDINEEIGKMGKNLENIGEGEFEFGIGGKKGGGFASGADFTVPSGFENDTFPMRVSSGEHVKVTPKGETNNSFGNINLSFPNMTNNSSVQDFINELRNDGRLQQELVRNIPSFVGG